MKMRAMGFVLLAMLGATSWAADEQRGWTMVVPLGLDEGMELTLLWKANRETSEIVEVPCESVKLEVTFSEPRDLVAPRTEDVLLGPDEPFAQFTAGFDEFGNILLVRYRLLEKRGDCQVLRSARVVRPDGTTITGGNFQIHPPNNGDPYD
ncbi:MAG: hypothetical protein P8Y15_15305 [Gemmatimonadales bacterium]